MKRFLLILFAVILCICMISCSSDNKSDVSGKTPVTDNLGNTVYLDKDAKVVSGSASFSEMWLLSGGKLCGVTDDAIKERNLDVGEAEIIGSVKHINMEKVVSLSPDYVILSADIAAHLSLKDALDNMGIPYGYFKEDTFSDYKCIMKQFCSVSGRDDLYKKNVIDVENSISDIKHRIPETKKTVLLIRTYSTGMKAKTDNTVAGQILREFGLVNIADGNTSMLEDLSMEHIVKSDPDYIFVTTMGNDEVAMEFLRDNTQNNPAWSQLSAIKEGNYHVLPKELFHYKPNNRWSESYEYLAKLIFYENKDN